MKIEPTLWELVYGVSVHEICFNVYTYIVVWRLVSISTIAKKKKTNMHPQTSRNAVPVTRVYNSIKTVTSVISPVIA